VFLALVACAREHRRRLAGRIIGWTTIGAADGGGTRGGRAIEAVNALRSADGDGMLGGTGGPEDGGEEERPRTAAGRARAALAGIVRAVGDGLWSWAYGGTIHDEAFLREFVARLEAEREAGREDPAAREERVKRAFRELCMVYRLGEEDFAIAAAPSSSSSGKEAGPDAPGGLGRIEEEADGLPSAPIPAASEGSRGPADPLERAELGMADAPGGGLLDPDREETKDGRLDEAALGIKGAVGPTGGPVAGRDVASVGRGGETDVKVARDDGGTEAGGSADEDQAGGIGPCARPAELADGRAEVARRDVEAGSRPSIDPGGGYPDGGGDAADLPPIQERRESGGSSVYECPLDDYWTLPADVPGSPADAQAERLSSLFAVAGGDEEEVDAVEAVEASALAARLAPPAPSAFDDGGGSEAPGFLHLSLGRRGRAHTTDGVSPPAPADVEISDQCAICLCEYGAEDVIVTSQNPDCNHAFHEECIVEWLVKMQDGAPCPCCRREFVSLEPHDGEAPRGRPRSNSEPLALAPLFDTSVISLGLPSRGGQRRQHQQRTSDGQQRTAVFDDRTFDSSVIRFRTPGGEAADQTPVFDDRTFDSSVIRFRTPGDNETAHQTPVFDDRTFDSSVIRFRAQGDNDTADHTPVFDGRTFDSSIIRLRTGGDGDGAPRTADEEERATRRRRIEEGLRRQRTSSSSRIIRLR